MRVTEIIITTDTAGARRATMAASRTLLSSCGPRTPAGRQGSAGSLLGSSGYPESISFSLASCFAARATTVGGHVLDVVPPHRQRAAVMNANLMMSAAAWIKGALVAAIAVRPLDPGLDHEELRQIVVGRDGIGAGTFRDSLAMFDGDATDARHRMLISSRYLIELMVDASPVPEEVRPAAALNALARVFDDLENQQGRSAACDRALIHARCAGIPPEQVDHALGQPVAWQRIERKGDAFARAGRTWPEYGRSRIHPNIHVSQVAKHAAELIPTVRDVFSRREGAHTPSEPATERFGRFLTKQGWTGFAGWWALTVAEMRSLSTEAHPSSICVLCGALLEAALVAIAKPAVDASEWKQKFLLNAPDKWKLGELIDQAEVSRVFRSDQRALADLLANQRNRIHAGKFQERDRFNPPYTNEHEARSARDNLATLLDAMLDWEPVKKLR